jgi:serine/threonine protein kinase
MELTPTELPILRQPTRPLWSASHPTDLIGQQLGNYRLIRLLARGGFAEVYLGEHVHLNRYAAIKVVKTPLSSDKLEQFRQEARIVANLRHPHIISIFDFDVEDDTPFLVMEYASNGTLRKRHPKGTILPPAAVLSYLKPVAEALQYAHDQHLIHRDVKPENMLIGQDDEILLSDFGIAVILYSADWQTAREIVGTISYIAPEQLGGEPCQASDQYSLGIVTYEWLCGKCPFCGSSGEIVAQHIKAPPPSLCELVPELPPPLEHVVLKALAKEPEQRHASVRDFIREFEAALASSGLAAGNPLRLSSNKYEVSTGIHDIHDSETIRATVTTVPPLEVHRPMIPTQPVRRHAISRRAVLKSTMGLATVGLASGSIIWLKRADLFTRPAPPPAPTPTLIPLGTIEHVYRGHHNLVTSLMWSPSEAFIASASADKTVQVWDTSKGGVYVYIYTGHSDAVNAVAWSPDGSRIASGSFDKTVQVWNASDGSNAVKYQGHGDTVTAVAWSPDDKFIASASYDKTVRIWNTVNGSNTYTYTGHSDTVFAVAWSPHDRYRIASASADKTVQVWNTADGSKLFTLAGHTDAVHTVAWSPDQQYIASGSSDRTVRVWNAITGSLVYTYANHSDTVLAVAWSPDGTRIASAGADKTVQIWGAFDGSNAYTFTGHNDAVNTLGWSSLGGGLFIASGSSDTTVQIWYAS